MKEFLQKSTTDLLFTILAAGIFAQQGNVAAGGEATGTGGNMSFSVGQTDFSGLPGGVRNHDGDFGTNGYFGGWWSTSGTDSGLAWALDNGGSASYGETNKEFGLSVRCIMDQSNTKD
jgi:uncharacterized protein (TIGR02145 family)